MDDRLDHLAFVVFENSLFLAGIDEGLYFLFRRVFFLGGLHFLFPAVEVVQRGHQRTRERTEHEMSKLENREKPQKDNLGAPHGDDSWKQVPENQHNEHRHGHGDQHRGDVSDRPAFERAEQKHGTEDQQHLDHDVDRHQDFGAGLQRCGKRGNGFRFRVIEKPAHGNLGHAGERDVDDRHHEKGRNQQGPNQNLSSAQHWNLRLRRRSNAFISPWSVSWSYPIK